MKLANQYRIILSEGEIEVIRRALEDYKPDTSAADVVRIAALERINVAQAKIAVKKLTPVYANEIGGNKNG